MTRMRGIDEGQVGDLDLSDRGYTMGAGMFVGLLPWESYKLE